MTEGLEIMMNSIRTYGSFLLSLSFMNTMLIVVLFIIVLRLISYLITNK